MNNYQKKEELECTCKNSINFCYKHSIKQQKISEEKKICKSNKANEVDEETENKISAHIRNDQNAKRGPQHNIIKPIFNLSDNICAKLEKLKTNYQLILQGHINRVKGIVITNDNKYIISCSLDKTIRV